MSWILTLSEDNLEEIIPLLDRYEQKIAAAEPIFKIEGRRLEEVIRTLPHYQSSYDQSHQEMKAVEEWLNNLREKRVSKHWKRYTEGYSRALSARDIQAYIAGEKDIVELDTIKVEVTLIKSHLGAIVEAIQQLGWMAGHMTKLRVAEMQDAIL